MFVEQFARPTVKTLVTMVLNRSGLTINCKIGADDAIAPLIKNNIFNDPFVWVIAQLCPNFNVPKFTLD